MLKKESFIAKFGLVTAKNEHQIETPCRNERSTLLRKPVTDLCAALLHNRGHHPIEDDAVERGNGKQAE